MMKMINYAVILMLFFPIIKKLKNFKINKDNRVLIDKCF